MAARTPTAKPAADTKCRGRWSVCMGMNPSRSADWHLCDACSTKRAKAMKAAKPAPTKKPAPKLAVVKSTPATMESEIAAMKAMKAKKPIARVAAMLAPEVTVAETS